MPSVYKDFALPFNALNHVTTDEYSVTVPGGRAYLRDKASYLDTGDKGSERREPEPYLDEVHFHIHDEYWFQHHGHRDKITDDPAYQGRIYAGCAGSVNLEYITATKAPGALLFDINPLQTVFWQGFFAMLAQCPDNKMFAYAFPYFVESFYYKIESLYGREVMQRHNMKPPFPPYELYRLEDCRFYSDYAPIRRYRYDEAKRWRDDMAQGRRVFDKWLADPDKYTHLHLLARYNALAALTLDIRDRKGCLQVAEAFNSVSYKPGRYRTGCTESLKFAQQPHTGAKAGFIYRSNVGYYLTWTKEELEEEAQRHARAVDYSGRPVTVSSYRQAHENLRTMLDPQGAYMISSDRRNEGFWGQFVPVLKTVTGKTPAAP